MTGEAGKRRRWLRPLGLFGAVLALSIARPLVVLGIPFALLAFLEREGRFAVLAASALILGLVFAGGSGASGLWYLERGWAIVLGGSFAAVTLARPGVPFLERGLTALGGTVLWTSIVVAAFGGWSALDAEVRARIDAGAASTLDLVAGMSGGESEGLLEAVERAVEAQHFLFPSLVALSSLAALGVVWWTHVRVQRGSSGGLGSIRAFTFPDAMIWLLIAGIILVIGVGGGEAWVRAGANLLVFMAGLYALRGAGVVLFVTGGLSVPALILTAVAAILAPPVLLGGAMAVGIGDTWFDLRERWTGSADPKNN